MLLNQCELRKIELSDRDTATIFVRNYLRREGAGRDLSVPVSRSAMTDWTRELIQRGLGAIDSLLEQNQFEPRPLAFEIQLY
jgi:molecular chaperone DnaK